jgi:hypothetical protein
MSLAKFSAKQMGAKLKKQKKLAALKKSEEDHRRKQEEIRLKEFAKQKERDRLKLEEDRKYLEKQWQIDQKKFMIKCLTAAMSGEKSIQTDEFSSHLKTKGFTIVKKVIERDPLILLDKNLKMQNTKNLVRLRNKLTGILESLMKLEIELANEKISRILQEKNNFLFCEKAFLFLSKYLNEDDDEVFHNKDESYEFPRQEILEYKIHKHYSLIRSYIPYFINDEDDEPEILYTLHWDKEKGDSVGDNWFNAKNLNWIASKAGRLFFDQFLALINLKTEALSSYLLFDAFEKSKYTYLIFDGKSKVRTPIPLVQLLQIFELFGYKSRLPRIANEGHWKSVKISWA